MSTPNKVSPRDISLKPQDPNTHAFASFFGKFEMDVTARLIVTLCSQGNQWREFTHSELCITGELESPPEEEDSIREGFEWLLEYRWIKHSDGARYVVTPGFIQRCKENSDERSK
ncbi:hypothetical protein KKC62_01875 [Patescibacteria group bacterium]|nr:hypothetical protein [Patescibacteria group bacterium]MBU1952930.1 hypothetical protein [Patescibacteria group bacterium]